MNADRIARLWQRRVEPARDSLQLPRHAPRSMNWPCFAAARVMRVTLLKTLFFLEQLRQRFDVDVVRLCAERCRSGIGFPIGQSRISSKNVDARSRSALCFVDARCD